MKKRRKIIAIYGWYGYDNVGDEAILSNILKLIRWHCDEVEIIVYSANPEKTKKLHNVESFYHLPGSFRGLVSTVLKGRFFSSFKALVRCDVFLLGGGGFLADWQPEAPFYWLIPAFIAKLLNKKVILFAVGVGPLTTDKGRWITRFVLNRVDAIAVRDSESIEWLLKAGVNKQIILSRDPTLHITPADEAAVHRVLSDEGVTPDESKPIVGISLAPFFKNARFWSGGRGSYQQLKSVIIETTAFLTDTLKAAVVFIPMHWPFDVEMAEEVFRDLPENVKSNVYLIRGNYDPSLTAGMIKNLDFLVSLRLHALIIAAAMGVPGVGISYNHKIKSFKKAMGLEEFLVELPDPLGQSEAQEMKEKLFQLITKGWENRRELGQRISQKVGDFKKQVEEVLESIIGFN